MSTLHEQMSDTVMKQVMSRYSAWRGRLLIHGYSVKQAETMASFYACMNRAQRRKRLRERGPMRFSQRDMTTVKSKQ